MEIKDIKPNQGNIDLVLTITEKGDVRTFQKYGKSGRVCTAQAKDDSGTIKLTLWNEDIDKVNAGDKIHLKNGWCSEYQGEKQLSTGRSGQIEILEKASVPPPAKEPKDSPDEEGPEKKEDSEELFTEEETIG